MSYWGYHVMLDCSKCSLDAVRSEQNIRSFLKELVPAIGMVAYGEPTVCHFATHDESKAGYSFCQMIETSSITGHLVDLNGDVYIDVFSCKPVDIGVTEDIVKKYFKPTKVRINFLTRNAE